MDNKLHQMCLDHFNEPMISGFEVVRCIGYGETAIDCYIITRCTSGKIVWNTCVGGYIFLDGLKGQKHVVDFAGEVWNDLARLDFQLVLNDCPREEEFLLELRPDDLEDHGKMPVRTRARDFLDQS